MTVVLASGWEVSQVLQVNQRCVATLGPYLLLLLAVFHPSACADTGALSDSSAPPAVPRPWGCSQPLGCVGLQSSDTSLCHVLGYPGEELHFGDCLRLLCSPCPQPLAVFCSANTCEGAT